MPERRGAFVEPVLIEAALVASVVALIGIQVGKWLGTYGVVAYVALLVGAWIVQQRR